MRGRLVLSCLVGLSVCGGSADGRRNAFARRSPVTAHVYPLTDEAFGPSVISASPRIEMTPRVMLVTSGDYRGERMVAFDRNTEKELWALPGKSPKGESSKVTLIGTAVSPPLEEIVVVRWTAESVSDLHGLDAVTGAIHWRCSLPPPSPKHAPAIISIQGSLVSIVDEGESKTGGESGEWRAAFLDAITGKLLKPGRDLRRAAGVSSSLALTQTPAYRPCLLRLDTGRCITLPIFRTLGGWGSTGSPVGVSGERAIVHVTTDDDGAGHSGWPRYLFAADETGRKVWQYPRQLIFPGTSDKTDWKRYESIGEATMIPDASAVMALSSRRQLLGVSASDGRVVWRTRAGSYDPPSVLSTAPYRRGCFVLLGNRAATGATRLIFVHAGTGAARQIASLQGARHIWVRGGELLVLTATPAVEAYSCTDLLSSRRQGPDRVSARLDEVWSRSFPGASEVGLGPNDRSRVAISIYSQKSGSDIRRTQQLDLATGKLKWNSNAAIGTVSLVDGENLYTCPPGPLPGELVALDWKAGKRLWRKPAYNTDGEFLAAEQGLVAWRSAADTVSAAAGRTGDPLWCYRQPMPNCGLAPLAVTATRLYLFESVQSSPRLMALDRRTSEKVLEKQLPGIGECNYFLHRLSWYPGPELLLGEESGTGAGVYIPALRAFREDLSTAWERRYVSSPALVGKVLVCVSWKDAWNHPLGLVGLDPRTGRELWYRAKTEKRVETPIGSWKGEAVVRVWRSGRRRSTNRLIGVDPANGHTRWSAPLPSGQIEMRLSGNRLLVISGQSGKGDLKLSAYRQR